MLKSIQFRGIILFPTDRKPNQIPAVTRRFHICLLPIVRRYERGRKRKFYHKKQADFYRRRERITKFSSRNHRANYNKGDRK